MRCTRVHTDGGGLGQCKRLQRLPLTAFYGELILPRFYREGEYGDHPIDFQTRRDFSTGKWNVYEFGYKMSRCGQRCIGMPVPEKTLDPGMRLSDY